jgi:hypothetical protein
MSTRSTYLWPSAEQIGELQAPNLDGLVSMLNLLRFKSKGGRRMYRSEAFSLVCFLVVFYCGFFVAFFRHLEPEHQKNKKEKHR